MSILPVGKYRGLGVRSLTISGYVTQVSSVRQVEAALSAHTVVITEVRERSTLIRALLEAVEVHHEDWWIRDSVKWMLYRMKPFDEGAVWLP